MYLISTFLQYYKENVLSVKGRTKLRKQKWEVVSIQEDSKNKIFRLAAASHKRQFLSG